MTRRLAFNDQSNDFFCSLTRKWVPLVLKDFLFSKPFLYFNSKMLFLPDSSNLIWFPTLLNFLERKFLEHSVENKEFYSQNLNNFLLVKVKLNFQTFDLNFKEIFSQSRRDCLNLKHHCT